MHGKAALLFCVLSALPAVPSAESAVASRDASALASPTGAPQKAPTRSPTGSQGGLCPPEDDDDDKGAADWVKKGGVAAIIFGALVSFWMLATVVEEYFVPALNIMCVRAHIPDDVAGATFMAAGASSPEMFSAIISLFITKSALGAGTIIGSEIFNHLCICAGAVVYSKTGELLLDWRILLRECLFYAAACGLLVFSLAEVGDSDGKDCDDWVYVRYYHGLILMGGYVVYALVCSFYGSIVAKCCPVAQAAGEADAEPIGVDPEVVQVNTSMADGAATYARMDTGKGRRRGESSGHVALDPAEEALAVDVGRARGSSLRSVANEPASNFVDGPSPVQKSPSLLGGVPDNQSVVSRVLDSLVPGLSGPQKDKDKEVFAEDRVECYIWKKSRFYNAFRMTTKTWQMRWAVIDAQGFRYFKGPEGGGGRVFNVFQGKPGQDVDVCITDPRRNIFEMTLPMNQKQQHFIFQAQNPAAVEHCVRAIRLLVDECKQRAGESAEENAARRQQAWDAAKERTATQSGDSPDVVEGDEGAAHAHNLMACPKSTVGKVFHVILLPFKAAMHYTMVDVRGEGKEKWWALTCIVSVVWLAVMSFVMTYCVEQLGALMGISELIMGLTVSAAGTSFPNVFASMLVARQGLGNMAISNAFGSNVFNIFMGLGLPWFLVCVLGNHDQKVDDKVYHGMKSGGVGFPVLVLLILLVAFGILLCFTGMRIYKSHAYVFTLLYIGFLVWAFGFELKSPDLGI
eukprot:TRINITY_DN10789_c1_g1_i1.p1 TRINITY_DN10789_c1_g1~~TRINITY_DN10789_c1_g1_i1.p1  ORF type:complete len:780 (+),score=299.03 TRINITY_DN10789_c1_g1_i1:109-2340(+)